MKSDRTAVNPAGSTRFRAMQHRNFQLFIAGQLISLIGTWMQTTAQLWLVYKLTGSAALLGVFGFASQVPMLFLSSIGGYVGDHYDRQRSVIATQTCSMILAFALAALTLANVIHEWEVIVIAFLVGIVNAFDVPIRQAFFIQMVGKEDLPNAIALNSSIFNGARVVGPAIAGFAIAELCGRDRGAADDEDRANGNETEQGFAAEKFCAGFSVCDERSAGAIGSLAAQRVESLWFAVFGVPADLRE